MIINPQVPLHRTVLSLSEALDHVSPTVADHQLRVAYMSTRIARLLGYNLPDLRNIFHAGALHDIGLMGAENRVRAIENNQLEGIEWHGEAGYELLHGTEFFSEAAPIIRHHHVAWDNGQGQEENGQEVPWASHILALTDSVDRNIQRNVPILQQTKEITEHVVQGQGKEFHPDYVKAFQEVSQAPAFWLDVTSKRIYTILSQEVDWPTLTIDETAVEGIAQVFARLVDCLSRWTGTHSAGVAAVAVSLAQKLNFSPREQTLMRAAGYLHDLGKITVPSKILDSPDKPTPQEWAILQGHTYYTFRILNTIGGMPQISEWAAFHHERLDGTGYPFGHRGEDLTIGSRILAVADTFTAITEDRPYRKGMDERQALDVLDNLVASGGLDPEVVHVTRQNFDA
ncbi:MAG: HD domain-containing protein, partial [Actinobacteria bacterium]|nr:HD domain-containing protein [Actinomycetota bacterium]